MTAGPWVRNGAGYARYADGDIVAWIAPDRGLWVATYRAPGGAWDYGTRGDDLTAASRTCNAALRSRGIACGDEVAG